MDQSKLRNLAIADDLVRQTCHGVERSTRTTSVAARALQRVWGGKGQVRAGNNDILRSMLPGLAVLFAVVVLQLLATHMALRELAAVVLVGLGGLWCWWGYGAPDFGLVGLGGQDLS